MFWLKYNRFVQIYKYNFWIHEPETVKFLQPTQGYKTPESLIDASKLMYGVLHLHINVLMQIFFSLLSKLEFSDNM